MTLKKKLSEKTPEHEISTSNMFCFLGKTVSVLLVLFKIVKEGFFGKRQVGVDC